MASTSAARIEVPSGMAHPPPPSSSRPARPATPFRQLTHPSQAAAPCLQLAPGHRSSLPGFACSPAGLGGRRRALPRPQEGPGSLLLSSLFLRSLARRGAAPASMRPRAGRRAGVGAGWRYRRGWATGTCAAAWPPSACWGGPGPGRALLGRARSRGRPGAGASGGPRPALPGTRRKTRSSSQPRCTM